MARAERGMSAPPEVVFNTATNPDRVDGWLPEPLRAEGRPRRLDGMGAQWERAGWSAVLTTEPAEPGGAWVRLDLGGGLAEEQLARLAGECLARLAEYVDDNLTAG